ncbi:MAG TPA: hypothetical protein VMT67_09175 [Terriglobales bacterium]|nr:hypothetical protein [Terriglobales bacterium]
MTNNNALALAVISTGLAAISYRFGYKGTVVVAIMTACVFAVWPIRLKWGLAGKEQWKQIRPKGRMHFVVVYSVGFCSVFAVWLIAPSYVIDNHLPKHWVWQLFSLLVVGYLAGLWEWRARERKYSD